MPFKTMRMSGPSPSFKKQKTSHTDHAKLARLQRQVAALKPEVKLFEQITTSGVVAAGGTVVPLSLIAQGTNAENRIGDAADGVALEMKIETLTQSSSTGAGGNVFTYAFLLVKDLESNGVVPAISGAQGVFVANTPSGALQQAETSKRFKVLRQRSWTVAEMNLSRQVFIHWNVKLNNKMTFHDNTATQTAAGKNSLYLIIITDDTGTRANYNVGSVLRFTDA